jgi:hypothetical protein
MPPGEQSLQENGCALRHAKDQLVHKIAGRDAILGAWADRNTAPRVPPEVNMIIAQLHASDHLGL